MGVDYTAYAGYGWRVDRPEGVENAYEWAEDTCEGTELTFTVAGGGAYGWDPSDCPIVFWAAKPARLDMSCGAVERIDALPDEGDVAKCHDALVESGVNPGRFGFYLAGVIW